MRTSGLAIFGVALLAVASHARAAGWAAGWLGPAVYPAAADYPVIVREYRNQTVRQTFRVAATGARLRVVLTNELGQAPLHVGAARVALSASDGSPLPGTERILSFSHRPGIIIPAGAPAYSDPVALAIPAGAEIEVSIFYPDSARPAAHLAPISISGPGDRTGEAHLDGAVDERGPALVSRLDVEATVTPPVIVALGDSITEGPAGRPGYHMSWPEQLGALLEYKTTLLNAGIGGNRLLHDGSSEGAAALARFDRDVVAAPGVREVVLLEGINDIGFGAQNIANHVNIADLVAADLQLIARAHEHGLRILAGTLIPFEGADYYTTEGERARQALNTFIRSGVFDGVIDFDQALRDPDHPSRLRPDYARPDHLHPSDAGFTEMASTALRAGVGRSVATP